MWELVFAAWLQAAASPSGGIAAASEVGSKACAGCHPAIYDSYRVTGMARSTGAVGTDLLKESFAGGELEHAALGVKFQVGEDYTLRFSRESKGVRGERPMQWFVGSGNVGRSYLYEIEGFLFQAPVSYFSAVEKWELSPGYAAKPLLDLARPVEPACLQCHASRLQAVAGTQNQYRGAPFLERGVSCERCHGGGRRHVAARGAGMPFAAGEIVNPSKLEPVRRDSICEQCHLTGAARVVRAGKRGDSYSPGDRLSDHLAVFVWADGKGTERAATDHAEQMATSGCKKGAGPKLACTSCHDPHSEPAKEARVAFYRARCLGCHEQKSCTERPQRRAEKLDDCAACHMPKKRSQEGEHAAFTDHGIPRRAAGVGTGAAGAVAQGPGELKAFWPGAENPRDLAIAYGGVGMERPEMRARALELLERAVARTDGDAALLSQLAQYYDAMGRGERARALYERALKIDSGHVAAGANVGVYWAREGRAAEAMALWEKIAAKNPSMGSVAMNLAVAQFQAGQREKAVATLERALRIQPDWDAARRLLSEMRQR